MVLFSVSNIKRNGDAIFLFSVLWNASGILPVNAVKCKETLQIHTFPVLFVFSGNICVVTVTNVKCNKLLKCDAFGLYFHYQVLCL